MEDKNIIANPHEYLDKPLWCVYGPDCFPTVFCFKLHDSGQYGITIWGYSVWKRQPGFRTLGQNLLKWDEKTNKPKYFTKQEDATAYLVKITTPKA